jgi:hypothetical protein
MCREQALRAACRLDAPHGPLTLAGRWVGVLSPVIDIPVLPRHCQGNGWAKIPSHPADTSSGFEALTSHLGVNNGLQMTSTAHSTTPLCRVNR